MPELNEMIAVIMTAIATGLVSSMGTVKALRVHISYINEKIEATNRELDQMKSSLARAHNRIDEHMRDCH